MSGPSPRRHLYLTQIGLVLPATACLPRLHLGPGMGGIGSTNLTEHLFSCNYGSTKFHFGDTAVQVDHRPLFRLSAARLQLFT